MQAAKGAWRVQGGVIPNSPEPQFTREWIYTSADYEADRLLPPMPEGHRIDPCGPLDQPHMSRFTRLMLEAHRYQSGITSPLCLNWVRCEFIWY